jgi:hypothetical protein
MPRRGISVEVTVDDSVIDEAFECYFNNHIPESESDRNEMKRDREWRVKVAYALADAALAALNESPYDLLSDVDMEKIVEKAF